MPEPLDIARANRFGRVIYEGNPRAQDYLAALAEVKAIRSELVRLRSRLRDLSGIEAHFPHDSLADEAAGAMSLAIIALYSLVDGKRSFAARADRDRELWEDIEANPESYVLLPVDENRRPWRFRALCSHEPPAMPSTQENDA